MKATLALLVLAQWAEAAPALATFSLSQVLNEGFEMDATSALFRAHAKYAGPPAGMLRAMEKNPELRAKFQAAMGANNTTVPAYTSAWYDAQYVVPVQIGTPGQTVYLNLDTGSSDLWTFSTDTDPLQVRGQVMYRPDVSNTSRLLNGEIWSVRYGDGAGAAGIVYRDVVRVGRTSVDSQAVQAAVQVSSDITRDAFASGILGLAMSAANTVRPTRQRTYLDNVLPSLASPLFTANLQKGRTGNYNFGYIDRAEYTGEIGWADVDLTNPLWKVALDGYRIGAGGYIPATIRGIVDTGTTLLLVPDPIVNAYYRQVAGAAYDDNQGMIVMPCSTALPDFTFGVGSFRGRIPGSYINYGQLNETHCFGGLQTSEGIPFAVFGDILLKAQFVVFDLGGKRVGFANKRTL